MDVYYFLINYLSMHYKRTSVEGTLHLQTYKGTTFPNMMAVVCGKKSDLECG